MSLLGSPFFFSSGVTDGFYPFQPTGCLRFEDGDSPKLSRTPTSAGNQKTWTWSGWIRRGNIGSEQTFFMAYKGINDYVAMQFDSDDTFNITYKNVSQTGGSLSSQTRRKITSAVFRDVSAWYNIVVKFDAANTNCDIYINGEEITDFSVNEEPQNLDFAVNDTFVHYIGASENSVTGVAASHFDGYLAEIYLVDGTALDESSFGQTKADIWVPKNASPLLTFGTNGFYLPFNPTVTSTGQTTTLYNGTSTRRSVQNFGYKPDFVWLKRRNDANGHKIYDRIRGAGKNLNIADSAEGTISSLAAFNPDGISLTGSDNAHNNSAGTYVAWAFDAGADQTKTGFGCVTFTGSRSGRSVADVGFSPDFVWIKRRDSGPTEHGLFDTVRGPGKSLKSNAQTAEQTQEDSLTSFDSDGFSLDDNGQAGPDVNYGTSGSYVAWCWDAGDSAPVSNSNGTIASTVKASSTYGFSIVSFASSGSSATVGHGLSSAPELIIGKNRDSSGAWSVYSAPVGNTKRLKLESTDAEQTSGVWGNTTPTSTVFTQNLTSTTNNMICYCFHSVSGYSKIGSYTGNGSATGPTVTTGFRPAWVMIKRIDSGGTGNWFIADSTRDAIGLQTKDLQPNSTSAEVDNAAFLEFTATGFQLKTTGTAVNGSGGSFLYMAFAGGIDTISQINTDGGQTSRVKASDATGFSIVNHTGSGDGNTIGHGLSSAPEMVFQKKLDSTGDWIVGTTLVDGSYDFLRFNTTAAKSNSVVSAPTSSVFSSNVGGTRTMAYCFVSTTGVSKFGTYTGTGGSSAVTVTTGFKPAFIMIKRTDSTGDWYILDSARYASDDNNNVFLEANTSDAESTASTNNVDFTSTGFVIDSTGNAFNANGGTFLYMAFAQGKDSTFFYDASGNSNNFDVSGLQNYDVVLDNPTNNFATMNPLDGNGPDMKEGNLKPFGDTASSVFEGFKGTFPMSSGKWYWEMHAADVNNLMQVGITPTIATAVGSSTNLSYHTDAMIYNNGGTKAIGTGGLGVSPATKTTTSYGDSYINGDIIGVALDLDSSTTTLEFYKNNVSQGTAFSSLASDEYVALFTGIESSFGIFNFGQDSSFAGTKTPQGFADENGFGDFYYSPPSGHLACCTQNLPSPGIDPANSETPSDYFNTVLYAGNGSSGHAITGVGFQPDWVWLKGRNYNGASHALNDSVRGVTKRLISDTNGSESTNAEFLQSFDSDGFTVGSHAAYNSGSHNFVSWNWLAGGSASSNSNGTITSSVSANTKAGFSIVSYTGNATAGATVGHGLSKAPEMYIVKSRSLGTSWVTYHKDAATSPEDGYLVLNGTDAFFDTVVWNDTAPTSSVFSLGGTGYSSNNSGATYIAYCFHSIDGYSKVGGYTGNGSTDGSFVYTGFRPAWLMIKRTDSSADWIMFDNKRDVDNEVKEFLYPNLNIQAATGSGVLDFLSNGFKLKNAGTSNRNASGGNYIYLAFAKQPFKYANAR